MASPAVRLIMRFKAVAQLSRVALHPMVVAYFVPIAFEIKPTIGKMGAT